MESSVEATLLTTTTYGTWLPGDARGYVSRGQILTPSPPLEAAARGLMKAPAVILTQADCHRVFTSLVAACEEFGYWLGDASIEATHLHAIIAHDDPIKTMVGRVKNRMRQAVGRSRIWTKGYCARRLTTIEELQAAREYIAKHEGACWLEGQPFQPPAPPGDRPCD